MDTWWQIERRNGVEASKAAPDIWSEMEKLETYDSGS